MVRRDLSAPLELAVNEERRTLSGKILHLAFHAHPKASDLAGHRALDLQLELRSPSMTELPRFSNQMLLIPTNAGWP